jgi:PAS domain S-box-containing protein
MNHQKNHQMNHQLKPDLLVKNGLLWLHPSHRPAMRNIAIILALLLLAMLLSIAMPPLDAARGIAHYLPLHTLLETFAIVVAVMVFAIAWNAHTKKLSPNIVLLGVMFVGVGLLDFSHMLSYAGMPDYVTPSGAEKAINFWLVARTLAALALLAVVVLPWRSPASSVKLFMMIVVVLLVLATSHWLILWRPELLPRTFIPGQGLTAFKINFEYAIIAINVVAAIVLWWRMRQPQPFNAVMLFGAVCVMAMSEIFFTLYADVTDIYNLLGHVYKVIAYLFIYRAIIVETFEQPYQQLSATQARMQATLNALPDLMFEVDAAGYIRDYHSAAPELLAVPPEVFMNKMVRECLPKESADVLMAAIRDAGETGLSHGRQYPLQMPQGDIKWFELSVARKAANKEAGPSYVVLSRDITKIKENEAVLQIVAQRAKALLDLPRIAEQMDEKRFMQYGQEIAEDLTGSEISFIHFVNKGGEEIELVAWSRRTLEHYCTAAYNSHYPLSQAGIWADALREGKPVVFNDYANYPHKHGLPEGHSPLQRLISVPVIENGKVVMMTGVGNKSTDYTDLDVETVQLISHEIWHIVQRVRTKNKLTRLGRALDQSNNEIYILDPQTWLFMDANQGALDKIGYSLQELVLMTPLDLKPEFTRESYAALIAPLLAAEQENIQFMTHHRCKDGTLYPIEVHLEMTQDEPPLLMQVVLDITQRKQAEEAVLGALTRLDRLAQHVPGMLYQYHLRPDGTSHFPYASSGIKEIYGVLPEQVSDSAEAVFKAVHPEDIQRGIESIQTSARTLSVWHEQYRVNLPDGRTIWVEGEASPEPAPDGSVLWHGHIRDITERKKTELLLHEQLDELHRWQQAMLGREGRIISIKQEVNELLARSGLPPRYANQLPEEPAEVTYESAAKP